MALKWFNTHSSMFNPVNPSLLICLFCHLIFDQGPLTVLGKLCFDKQVYYPHSLEHTYFDLHSQFIEREQFQAPPWHTAHRAAQLVWQHNIKPHRKRLTDYHSLEMCSRQGKTTNAYCVICKSMWGEFLFQLQLWGTDTKLFHFIKIHTFTVIFQS